jgi:PepSY-associated transmembrane protein
MKKWLFIVHRWIGICTCLLFAIWFLSGLVMVYVPFPQLEPAEELASLPEIAYDQVRIQPDVAARNAGVDSPRRLRLEMQGRQPVWRVQDWEGDERVVSANSGETIESIDGAEAARIASISGHASALRVEALERDQWTVPGRFNRHRPLWKVTLSGADERVLYVSSRTGAVVLDTSARERFWNWIGAVPHWIYPTVLRHEPVVWRQVVMWTSGVCILAAITGVWVGVLRVRLGRRRFEGGRATPFRGSMLWHHIAGLVGGVTLICWIFSGWLSVDPFHLFDSPGMRVADERAFAGSDEPTAIDMVAVGSLAGDARRVELLWVAGMPLLLAYSPFRPRLVLNATTLAPAFSTSAAFLPAARRLMPGAPLVSVETLTEFDAYWYGARDKPVLPVLRLRFADPASTWVHLDASSGQLLGAMDRRARAYRWAFDLLHKWDLNFLTRQPVLRETLLWMLSALGLVTSFTGIWIGWKRLRIMKTNGSHR